MIRTLGGAAALVLMAAPAAAVTTLSFAGPETQTVIFDGFTDKGGSVAGLGARLDLTLVAIGGGKAAFEYKLTNLSAAPVDAARISLFGFDVAGFKGASASGDYARVGSGNVPMIGAADVCFAAAGRGGSCAGGGGAGIWGGEAASGAFTLTFADTGLPLVLDNLFVRYQAIDSKALGIKGGSGVGQGRLWQDPGGNNGVVPEPATWLMLIAGFGLVGLSMRRRRDAATEVQRLLS